MTFSMSWILIIAFLSPSSSSFAITSISSFIGVGFLKSTSSLAVINLPINLIEDKELFLYDSEVLDFNIKTELSDIYM